MDLTTVDKLLTTTRSVRKRLDLSRPVEPGILQQCLDIAIQAPTGGNRQGYHFVVVTDAAKRAELAAIYKRSYLEVYTPARQEETRQTDPGSDRFGNVSCGVLCIRYPSWSSRVSKHQQRRALGQESMPASCLPPGH